MAKSLLQSAMDGDFAEGPVTSATITAPAIAESKSKAKGLKIMSFDEFARGKNTLEVNLAYRDYLNESYRSGQVEDVGSLEHIKKIMTESFGSYGIPGLVEDLGRDIAAIRGGKRAVRERQSGRIAGLVGQVAPRTKQQTASLLSSSQAAPATLLG